MIVEEKPQRAYGLCYMCLTINKSYMSMSTHAYAALELHYYERKNSEPIVAIVVVV